MSELAAKYAGVYWLGYEVNGDCPVLCEKAAKCLVVSELNFAAETRAMPRYDCIVRARLLH